MNDITTVTVQIPQRRLAELYTMCGDWLREWGEAQAGSVPKTWDLTPGALPDEEAVGEARLISWKVSDQAQKILDVLIDHPGEKRSTEALAQELQFQGEKGKNRLTGTLSSIARQAKAVDREVPYQYEENHYWVNEDVARVFQRAREAGPVRRRSVGDAPQFRRRTGQTPGGEEVPMPDSE